MLILDLQGASHMPIVLALYTIQCILKLVHLGNFKGQIKCFTFCFREELKLDESGTRGHMPSISMLFIFGVCNTHLCIITC